MESMQSCDITTLSVGKARKKNSYYTCPIYSNRKHPFYVHMTNAYVMGIKDTGSTVILKCKSALSYMDELTSTLLKIVELNHTEWFNSSIDETFIEEYFTTPIHYDNRNGIVLRIKVKNLEDIDNACINNKVNVSLVLKNITFLRQKFYPVFEIHNITNVVDHEFNEFLDDDGDVSQDEDDDVVPSHDEVVAMKQETLTTLKNNVSVYQTTINETKSKLDKVLQYISKLEKCMKTNDILKCCEEIGEEC